jgi:hypothetical protein
VPWIVALRAVLGGPTQVGAIFLLIGAPIFWMGVWNADVPSLWRFRGELATTPGIVLASRDTHVAQGKRGRHEVFACDYEFHVEGETRRGTSYGNETHAAQAVKIEFRRDDPTISRVQGMRAAPLDAFVAFTGILPLFGVLVLAGGIWSGLSAVRLLREGVVTRARPVAKEEKRVNRRRVFKLTFRFLDDSGVERTHIAETVDPKPVTDEHEELLVYDPLRPERALLVDAIPGSPRFGEMGDVEPASVLTPALLILPALAVTANVLLSQVGFFR